MDDPLLPRVRGVHFEKNQSQLVLPDNELAQQIKQPQGFRRHYLISTAISEGRPSREIPLIWRIPFLKSVNDLDVIRYAGLVGTEYQLAEGSGLLATYIALVKSMICTAILFVPRGFMRGGWLFSALVFLGVAVLYTISMIWLAQARLRNGGGTYASIAEKALGSFGYYFVEMAIIATQLGFFMVTCVFINSNMQNLAREYGFEDSLWVMNLVQFLLLCPLLMMNKIQDLTLVYLVSNLLIIAALIYIVVGNIEILSAQGVAPDLTPFNSESFLLIVGMGLYSYEGISMMIPIKAAMKQPEKFSYVAVLMMCTVASLLTGFGLICYFTYGLDTQQIITLNMEMNTGTTVLIGMYLVAALFTHPMTMFPPLASLDMWIGQKMPRPVFAVAKLLIAGVLSVFAVLVNEKVDRYISLLGSLLCGPLAYIMPALINLKLNAEIGVFGKGVSVLFVAIGVASTVICVWSNLASW